MTRTRTRCTAPGDVSQFRRMAVVAWGGAAVSWQLCAPAPDALLARLVSVAAFLLLATGTALYIRQCLLGELRRTQEIAGAAQQVLLRPLPPRMEGLALAAAQLSASRGAAVGGDLYEAVATPTGSGWSSGTYAGTGCPRSARPPPSSAASGRPPTTNSSSPRCCAGWNGPSSATCGSGSGRNTRRPAQGSRRARSPRSS